jgi:hypothetical protein
VPEDHFLHFIGETHSIGIITKIAMVPVRGQGAKAFKVFLRGKLST